MLMQTELFGTLHIVSDSGTELFPNDVGKAAAVDSVLDMMNDCLDYFYNWVKPIHPDVFRPGLYVSSAGEVNACAKRNNIYFFYGLIAKVVTVIENKYTEEVLGKYSILKNMDRSRILSGLRVYTWRFVVLHELFHIWHAHVAWLRKYRFVDEKTIITRLSEGEVASREIDALEEMVSCVTKMTLPPELRQFRVTQQAIELDADCCAISMLINMLMRDAENRFHQGLIQDKKEYIAGEMGLMMGALSTVFSIFDGNSGAHFEVLSADLECKTHPLPAIRMYVAEDVADAMLWKYFPEKKEHFAMETEWLHIVCDVEPYHEGKIDMGRVFYFTAYTEKAQKHLEKLRFRLKFMHDTLEELAVFPLAEELEDEDIEYDPMVVRFAEDGTSLKGWVNPATQ